MFYGFLSRGFLFREIPPGFTSVNFTDVIRTNRHTLPPEIKSNNNTACLSEHSIAKVGIARRRVGLSNPIKHLQLSATITIHWQKLLRIFKQSKLSKSIPISVSGLGRAIIPECLHSELNEFRMFQRSTNKYVLKTDISKFYPSLYTHSIPWAIHSKPVAKRNHSDTLYGNLIDKRVRNSQDCQTKGIPIGPDTSFVIAETVLCACDQEIQRCYPDLVGFRHVDDYEISVKTYSKAEEILTTLQEILKAYELEINFDKTKIIELPSPLNPKWINDIRKFQIRNSVNHQRKDLFHYYDLVLRFAEELPNDFVLKYAIGKLNNIEIHSNNWHFIEDFIYHSLMVDPGSFFPVLSLLVKAKTLKFDFDIDRFKEVIDWQICTQGLIGHASEVAWSIWASLYFQLSLSEKATKILTQLNDPIINIMTVHASELGITHGSFDMTNRISLLNEDDFWTSDWLLMYECKRNNWDNLFGGSVINITNPCLRFLLDHNVSFYDRDKSLNGRPTGATMSNGRFPLFSFPEI